MEEKELNKWKDAKEYQIEEKITLGPHFSFHLKNTPRRIIFALSRYKFAAKLIGENKDVLELGCSEGYGSIILGEFAERYVGVDIDEEAVFEANKTFATGRSEFICGNILNSNFGTFDAVTSFDVIEHIYPENENDFFKAITDNLTEYGIGIIGTPNITADVYSSPHSKTGHVNLYSWERLKKNMEKYFHQVFIFSSNDEMVHTGFYPMAQYLIAVGICKKARG